SSMYTLATKPPQIAASAQVSASGQVAASCSCRLLSHQTLQWHHRLGDPSLPRLRGMRSRFLVSGLPRSLPPLPPSPAPPCLPCVEGRQRAAPHSSSFPPTSAPLQTLHMDVWGPARVSGQGRERYFLLVVDDYTRYTTVFPLRSKGEVPDVLIPWIRTVRLQLRKRYGTDLPVLRLHSDRGGEFSSNLLRDFCRGEGILQSFTLPDSPRQNGIAEHRIGLVMEVARTSMIHAAAPHFLWPFAVRYAAHQLNLWPRVSLPETSPTLRWTGEVGDASVFRVWGSRAFVRDTPAEKLSAHAIPCVFLGFVPDDVTFDESVQKYRLFPYHSAPPPPPPLFLAPGPPPVDPLPPQGPAPSGVSQAAPLPGTAPVQPGGAESERAEFGGAAPRGAVSFGGPAGALSRLSSQQLREWLVRCAHRRSGAPGAGGAGDTGAGGVAVTTGAGGTAGIAATGPGGARTSAQEALELRELELEALAPEALKLQELELLNLALEALCGRNQRREPAFPPVSPVRTARRTPRSQPPPVPGTHATALRPSSVPLRVPLPAPPESSLPKVPDPASDRARAASPTVSRLLATADTGPLFESAAAAALVAELLDFAAACRLDHATALVAESVFASPPSIGGECALGTDVLEDRHEDFESLAAAVPRFASMLLAPEGDPDAPDIPTSRSYVEAITGPYSSQWQAVMDAEMASWKVKRSPGSPPAFKARHVARGFSQRQGVDYFHTFSPTPKMTTLWVLLHVAAQRDYELLSLDFSTAFLQGSLHEEIWVRGPPGFTGTFPAGTQWSLRRPVYCLRQAPREWNDTLRTTLAALGFAPSTADPSLFLRTDTPLPPFYILVYVDDIDFATADTEALTLVKSKLQKRHTCTDLGEIRSYLGLQITRDRARRTITLTQSHMSVELSGPYLELVGCLMYLINCTRPDLAYPLSLLARYVAPAPVVRAAQELRWLTYLLTDLGEQPRSPRVLYLDNKAMIALCKEHRLEHRTKHIALRYFFARELQQCGQLRLAYVATRANTADVFTKALPPACFAFFDWRGIRARAGEEDAEEEEEEEGLTGDEGEEGGVGEEAEGEDRGEGEAAVEGEQAEREAEEDAESDGEDWNLLHEYGLDSEDMIFFAIPLPPTRP
ncbi:unnamed protein product, partial [Closterium sp. NIES-53]